VGYGAATSKRRIMDGPGASTLRTPSKLPAQRNRLATLQLFATIQSRSHRLAARRDVPPPLDVHIDFIIRRASDLARFAAFGSGIAACRADADGSADGDGNRALRPVLAANRSVARSRAEAAGIRGWGIVDRGYRRLRSIGVVVRLAVDGVALLRGIRDRRSC